jgi:hypothetical protein
MLGNCGYAFVTFMSNLQVKRLINKEDFEKLVNEKLSGQEIAESEIKHWKIMMAPVMSDIIWDNMMSDDTISSIKSWILLVILFVVCVILITPTFLIDHLKPIIDYLKKELNTVLALALQTFFAPLIVLMFNSGLLPLFIDFIAYLEGHKSKSQRQIGIMRKNFFFQMFNIIFLSLMGQTLILGALEELLKKNVEDWQKLMGANLVNNNWFFLRYSI